MTVKLEAPFTFRIPISLVRCKIRMEEMANKPAAYGFSNVTTPYLLAPPGTSPDQFLFWDPVHPTTGAHEVLADEALEQIIRTFSPSHGRGTPDGRANALHGLVNACQHNPWSRN